MSCYIYFIQVEGNGPIKIGTTKTNPRRRMKNLKTGCPHNVQLLGSIFGDRSKEQKIHQLLAPWRRNGEWFDPHPIVIAAVQEALRLGIRAPFVNLVEQPRNNHPLCKFRFDANLSLGDLAEKSGLTVPSLSRLERGLQKPGPGTLRILSEITGLTFAQLRPDFFKERA